MDEIIIVGAGIGGLTLGLALHAAGIPCRIFESAAEIRRSASASICCRMPPGNSPRSASKPRWRRRRSKPGCDLLQPLRPADLQEPLGRAAGYDHPQFSIHRGDLQMILLDAFCARAGADRLHHQPSLHRRRTGRGRRQRAFSDGAGRRASHRARPRRDRLRRHQFRDPQAVFPDEGEPRYSGVNMWRGVTRWKPMLSGASMVRAGWLSHGKMVIYPIRPAGADGLQLVNWVAEIETPDYRKRDWNRPGSIDDFIGRLRRLAFRLARRARASFAPPISVLEFPMVDQDPLPRWSFGRVTLLGDAAHPMVPRGSNGAGQAILDARRADLGVARERRSGRGTCGLRKAAAGGHHAHRADQPHQSARCDPARGVSAHQRPAVRGDRGRHQPRGTGRACPKATSRSPAIRRKHLRR